MMTTAEPCPRTSPARPARPLRAPALLASAAALGLLLAACGGDDEDPFSSVDTSRRDASASPSAAATASPAPSLTASPDTKIPSSGEKVAATTLARRITEAATEKRTLAFETITSGTGAMGGEGQAEGTGKTSRVHVTADVSGGKVEIVKNRDQVFFKSPQPVGGKPWLRISQSATDPFSRIYTQVFAGLEGAADVPVAAEAIARMGTFRTTAQEQVDGVATTKYMAAPRPSTGVALLSPAYQALTAEQLKDARTTVSLWVDADGLLRRTVVVFELRGVQSTQTLTSYKDWGKPVTITPPPASQVVSGSQLANP